MNLIKILDKIRSCLHLCQQSISNSQRTAPLSTSKNPDTILINPDLIEQKLSEILDDSQIMHSQDKRLFKEVKKELIATSYEVFTSISQKYSCAKQLKSLKEIFYEFIYKINEIG